MDCLSFNVCLIDQVLDSLFSNTLNVLGIIDKTSLKSVGHLTILPESADLGFKPLAGYDLMKRTAKSGTAAVKPKITKTSSFKQQPATSNENSSLQVQTSFQQDPNDMIGAMQSLESGEKVFTCKLCGLQGKQKANVRGHVIRKHMKSLKETFSCSMCDGKSFSSKQNLKHHYMRSHNMNEKVANAAIDA